MLQLTSDEYAGDVAAVILYPYLFIIDLTDLV